MLPLTVLLEYYLSNKVHIYNSKWDEFIYTIIEEMREFTYTQ